ncbi:hypothetical protein [Micromonospora parathelypteridis]|uniref:Uncharacterized protein n=1 Tax=Micromonospora parathelypteridis TaxID=1839617 RepID=A0A840W2X2_9ACTN|nr:hypothetical protein [Micromonospora parathelypteridis]MBB5478619.1 hypothetical protein [Micromonospora parathelypteridis]GGO05383.1 hypothetical protein GCM10011576_07900 [Micromonospora parathelypteridis]
MADISYQERLGQLVEPGERVLAVAKAEIAQGVLPADPPVGESPEASGGGRGGVVSGVLLNLISPLISFSAGDRIVDRITHGVAGRGVPGSAASTLRHSRRPVPPVTTLYDTILAVTDRRLLACASGPVKLWSSQTDDARAVAETQVVWSAPRAAVADARVGWHRLNPKRLRIEFTDGSWLAFTVPIAEPGKPLREIASALTGR